MLLLEKRIEQRGGMVMKRQKVFYGLLLFLLLMGGFAWAGSLEEGKKFLSEGVRTFQKEPLLKARSTFEGLVKANPNDPKIHYLLSQSFNGLSFVEELVGNKDGASSLIEEGVKVAKKSVELNDSSSDSHCLLASLYGRLIAQKGGMAGMTYGPLNEEEIQKALRLDPQNPQAHLELGISRVNTPPQFGGDLEVGVKSIEKAISIDPKLDMAYYHLGRALMKKGEKERAKEVLKKGFQINPNNGFIKRELEKI
jgi:tetratricopeptide (TPR) repeat protein